MDFSEEAWREAIQGRSMVVVKWLRRQPGLDRGNNRWSQDCVLLPREEQEILYARMMIEVPAEGET